jgi:hypothetical protein
VLDVNGNNYSPAVRNVTGYSQGHQDTETLFFSAQDVQTAIDKIENEFNQNQKIELRQQLQNAISELIAKGDTIIENDQMRIGNGSISCAELRTVGVSFDSTSNTKLLSILRNDTPGAQWAAYGDFVDRQRQNLNLVIVPVDLDLIDDPAGEYKDTSVQPQITHVVERNNPKTHRAIVEATVSRTSWVEEPRPENGKIFDLDFGILSREIVQNIRQTSAQNSPEMHDTPMETLRDIYELTPEDIELFDGDYQKEALRLIQEDMQRRIQEADGDVNRGLMNFAEMVMHYPPNDDNFGKIGEPPDFGKWTGDFKVGFRMMNNGLEIVKPEPPPPIASMKLKTTDRDKKLELVFTVDTTDDNGRKKTITYSIVYDIANRDGDEENPRLYINGSKESENLNGLTIVDYLTSNNLVTEDNMKEEFQNVSTTYRLGGLNNTERSYYLYINRLELVARIGFKRGDFVFKDNGVPCIFRYQEEYTNQNPYKFLQRNSDGDIIEKEKEGWLYTVTIGGKVREVLIPRSNDPNKTNAENNDILLMCFGKVNDILMVPRISPAPFFDEDGRVWIVSNGNNQLALAEYYKPRTNNPFWNENKLFLGGR